MPHATINGIKLHYDTIGVGDPLLLITGLGADASSWGMQLPRLAAHFRVITFDNRGAGRSETPPGPYSTAEMARDAVALLDHLGIERAHVVGWSLGSLIAQELALSHGDRVHRLALLSTFARPDATIALWLTIAQQAEARGVDAAGIALWSLPWMFTPAFMTQPAAVAASLPPTGHATDLLTVQRTAAQAAAILGHDSADRLQTITAPTLVLVGAEDILSPPVYAQEVAAAIPGAQLHLLDYGGHGMMWEYSEAVTDALLAFLRA